MAAASLIAALVAGRRGGDSIFGRKGIAVLVARGVAARSGRRRQFRCPFDRAAGDGRDGAAVQLLSAAGLAAGLLVLVRLLRPRLLAPRFSRFTPSFARAVSW